MLTADVAVVGGGPAGAAAAITLARAGRKVTLVDKAAFPRDKCCGDGLTTSALRRLEALGLQPDAVASWRPVGKLQIRSPSGRTNSYSLPVGKGSYAVIARRTDLDAALLDVARSAGVDVREGHPLVSASPYGPGHDAGAVTLEIEGLGPLAARYAIGADGMWSPLRKALKVLEEPGYLGESHAFRQYFSDVGEAAAGQMWVWFFADLLPGYAWSFPLPGRRANVGFGIRREKGVATSAMKQQWAELLTRPAIAEVLGPDAVPEGPHKAWPIPARVERTALTAAGGRALFVGDAARATDPLTGEGIGQALEMGVLAAEAMLAAGADRPWAAGEQYEKAVRNGLTVDNRLAGLLARVVGNTKGIRGSVRVSGLNDWTRQNFVRWLFEDYPRAVLGTPHRWRPGMFSGPGAYIE